MAMSKKDFIALADAIRTHNKTTGSFATYFFEQHLNTLADFCQSQNPQFMRDRWLGYIAGTNGRNGGAIVP